MAGAPAIVSFVGGTYKDAVNFTLEMYEITEQKTKTSRYLPWTLEVHQQV